MDRPTCKLCFRRFPNGRALGGHMRSHNPPASAVVKQQQVRRGHVNSPTSSSSSGPHQPSVKAKIQAPAVSYGLRENPRKSAKLADPEFSNPDDEELPGYYNYGSGYYYQQQQQHLHQSASSAVVQDGESETESSMAAAAGVGAVSAASKTTVVSSSRRRSKRRRREDSIPVLFPSPGSSAAAVSNNKAHDDEQAPVSSVSDATPDEDVALCLVMLSRDTWPAKDEKQQKHHRELGGCGKEVGQEASYNDDDYLFDAAAEEEDDSRISGSRRGRSRFRCGTCKKTFRSYQALGGHRASHKKAAKTWNAHAEDEDDGGDDDYLDKHSFPGDRIQQQHREEEEDVDDYSETTGSPPTVPDPRIHHQCPFCSRVFVSGQALGGHKRSHFTYSSSNTHYSYPPPPPPAAKHAGEQASRGGNNNGNVVAFSSPAATRGSSNYRRRDGTTAGPYTDDQLGDSSSFLDLNLPAPMDHELDVEVSAVSTAN